MRSLAALRVGEKAGHGRGHNRRMYDGLSPIPPNAEIDSGGRCGFRNPPPHAVPRSSSRTEAERMINRDGSEISRRAPSAQNREGRDVRETNHAHHRDSRATNRRNGPT